MDSNLDIASSIIFIEKDYLFNLIYKADYESAFEIIDEASNKNDLTFIDQFKIDYSKAYISMHQHKPESEILNLANNLYEKSKIHENPYLLFKSIILLLELNRRMFNNSECDRLISEGEEILKNLPDQQFFEHLNLELNYQKSSILTRLGKVDNAILLLEKAIISAEKHHNDYILIRSYNDLGICFGRSGNLDSAQNYFIKCLELSQRRDNKFFIASSNTNLAIIYQLKGEVVEALNFAEQGLQNNITLKLDLYISEGYRTLGNIQYSLGNHTLALEYYNKSLKLREISANDFFQAQILYHLIILLCDLKNFSKAKSLLEKLEIINNNNENAIIHQFYKISNAVLLRYKKSFFEKGTALEIFKEIAYGEILEDELSVFATLNLFELLLEEIKVFNNASTFKELLDLIEKLDLIATLRNSYSLIVQVYLLKSRFTLLNGDFSASKQLLETALNLTNEKSLKNLKSTVQSQLRLFMNLESSYKEFMLSNNNFSDRLEFIGLDNVVGLMRKNQFGTTIIEQYKKLSNDELGLIIWKITNLGPEAFGVNVPEELISSDQLNFILPYMGPLFTSVLGQGDAYHQGIFGPLPIPLRREKDPLDALIASKIIKDSEQEDIRQDGKNFLVLGIIFPSRMHLARYELSLILNVWWETIVDVAYFNDLYLENLRKQLLEELNYIIY